MKLLRNLLLAGIVAGATALVWNAATAGRHPSDRDLPGERGIPPEVDPDTLSDEERDLLLRELAAHL